MAPQWVGTAGAARARPQINEPQSSSRPFAHGARRSPDVPSRRMYRDLLIAADGFSIIIAVTLLAAYLTARWIPKRTPFAIASCALLSSVLCLIQWWHLQHLLYDLQPADYLAYRLCVYFAPALFFYFARALVLPDAPLRASLAVHLFPGCAALALPTHIALPLILGIGTGYALWLSWLVATARRKYRQVLIERSFAGLITLSALLVLTAGLLGDGPAFYAVYGLTIASTYAMVLFALVAIPDFVNELFEQTQLRYAVSTLGEVDVDAALVRLERAMTEEQLYREASLSLASLAAHVGMSGHQLSELLNRHLGRSFTQYVRGYRLDAAQGLLRSQPGQSVLSIALEIGFRSQSTFYAAFKEAFGLSPGAYRRAQRTAKAPE